MPSSAIRVFACIDYGMFTTTYMTHSTPARDFTGRPIFRVPNDVKGIRITLVVLQMLTVLGLKAVEHRRRQVVECEKKS